MVHVYIFFWKDVDAPFYLLLSISRFQPGVIHIKLLWSFFNQFFPINNRDLLINSDSWIFSKAVPIFFSSG